MSNYNFNYTECTFVKRFLDSQVKAIYWKEYGANEWYIMDPEILPSPLKATFLERKIIRMMVKLGLLLPEIEDDKEYAVQRALGCVIGRIYYMPKEIREEFKDEAIDI
ncbi:hypothetical protein LCGC14_1224630 [marine sediment metagenome]|uniref:Uncharacterized protein n=1 Tax=marine sediment metagenome TaxID=412755 RepID=A0A0F9NSL4_9ZZZZ